MKNINETETNSKAYLLSHLQYLRQKMIFFSFLSFLKRRFKDFWSIFFSNPFVLKLGGGLIVFSTLYFRFIRSRAVGPLDLTYTDFKFFLYIFLISIFLISLIVVILAPFYIRYLVKESKGIINKTLTYNPNTIFSKMQRKLINTSIAFHKFYEKFLESFYAPLFHKFIEGRTKYCYNFLDFVSG